MIRANTQWKWRQIRFLDLWAELPSGSLNIKPTMLRPQIYSIIMNGIHKPVLFLYVLPLQHNTSSKIHWDKLDKEIFFFFGNSTTLPFLKEQHRHLSLNTFTHWVTLIWAKSSYINVHTHPHHFLAEIECILVVVHRWASTPRKYSLDLFFPGDLHQTVSETQTFHTLSFS